MNVHFSSKTNEWATPQQFFNELNDEFHFTLDPCATKENAKVWFYYTKEQNGLIQDWNRHIVFCNPPYGREIGKWVKKASEAKGGGSGNAYTSKNRYKILSRLYLSKEKCRNTFLKRKVKVWWIFKRRTFSFYGCDF